MFERFTDRARKVMALANQEASRFNHQQIETGHILLGLIKENFGVAASVLKNMDVSLDKARIATEKLLPAVAADCVTMDKIPHSTATKKFFDLAVEESRSLNHNYIGTEHLLLGLLRTNGVARTVLDNLGVKIDDVRDNVLNLISETSIVKTEEEYYKYKVHKDEFTIESLTDFLNQLSQKGWEIVTIQFLDKELSEPETRNVIIVTRKSG